MDEEQISAKGDVGGVRPTSLGHLTGQYFVREQVAVALEAAWADGRRCDHALLVGPPGLGKSALANIVASEMATDLHEVLGQSLSDPVEMHALLLAARDKDVIHIDEVHELAKPQQTALYLALDKRVIYAGVGGRKPQPIPLSDFTLLLSTTDEYRVLQPLRDRMRLTLRFQFYDPPELAEIVRQRARALRWTVEDDVPVQIAQRSRGTPRIALSLLQAAYRVCRAAGETVITVAHLSRACDLAQIDPAGLGVTEMQYVLLLADGPMRLNVIASKLGLPARTVAEVAESFLIRVGFAEKLGDGRRQLTAMGVEHARRMTAHERR